MFQMILKRNHTLFLMLFWAFTFIISFCVPSVFLANGEFGAIEMATNILYIVGIYVVFSTDGVSSITKWLFGYTIFLLLSREINMQRQLSTAIFGQEFYQQYIRLPLYFAFYSCEITLIAMELYKRGLKFWVNMVHKNITIVVMFLFFAVISQIADGKGGMFFLAIEETMELMLPIIILLFFVKNRHQMA